MFNNYLKITLRNLWKNRLFVLINVSSLAIALSCCIVAYLNWEYNNEFDSYHSNTDDVYRVNFIRNTNGRPIQNGMSPMPLANEIKNNFSQVKNITRYTQIGGNLRVDNQVFNTEVSAVDPAFFELFNFPMIGGRPLSANDPQNVVISKQLQEKHFPRQPLPIGESLTYINGDKVEEFQVIGVFENPPMNTSFDEDLFMLYDKAMNIIERQEDNWALFNKTFIQIPNEQELGTVTEGLQAYVAIQNEAKKDYKVASYYLDPFVGMAVRAERQNVWNHSLRQSLPSSAAVAPGIMAFLLLLLACFNFTNTSIAIVNRRIKEIGIRKVLGAQRRELIFQFIGENLLIVTIALVFALLLSAILTPAYSAMWPFLDIHFNLFSNLQLVGFIALLLVFTALTAGSYPSLYISKFHPNVIFRGKIKFSGTNYINRILLTLQYAISLLAIISGFVFSQNAQYQKDFDMGFDMEHTIFAYVENEQGYTRMRNELRTYDMIKDIAGSRHNVSSSWYSDPIKFKEEELDVAILDIGAEYLSAIDAKIVAGRNFQAKSQTDKTASVIINEELARTMGWVEPINQRIVLRDTIQLNVVGVVKDIYYEGGLWEPLEPMMMRYVDQEDYRFLTVRSSAEDLLAVKALMDEKWSKVFPTKLSTVTYMVEQRSQTALVNNNIKVLFLFLGMVAVLLSAIGLFSLVSLNLLKRMKEIGVRKVLGASVQNIIMKVSREFIIILLIASIIGSVAGYFMTDLLLSSIWTYHVPLQPLPIILAIFLLIFLSALTIGTKVFRTAKVNPAEVLRSE